MSRVTIIGAGAIGSLLAARLHEHGHDVSLIARGSRLEAIRRDGLVLREDGSERRLQVRAAERCDPRYVPDHVVVATKTFQLAGALALLEPYRDAAFGLLTVQNGVEAPQIAEAALPSAHVLGARVHGFFEMAGNIVNHTGVPATIVMGPNAKGYRTPAHERASDDLASTLRSSAVPSDQEADVRPALWDKFLMAATIGSVAPAFGLTVGQVHSDSAARSMLEASMHEVAGVAAALGIDLPNDCVASTLDFVSRFPPDVTSSLQRDLEAGRPSEFAHLTGAIPRFAALSGLPAPCADQLIRMLHARGLRPS